MTGWFATAVLFGAVACVVALADLPYEYYMVLRIAVCTLGLFSAWKLRAHYERWLAPLLVVVALLYNPFLPAHLTRELWSIINLATAFILALAGDRLRRLT